MASPVSQKTTMYRSGETVYGTLISGTFTDGSWDLTLGPGLWSITLFINANGVSAGTLTASPISADGTALTEEPYVIARAGGAITFADHVGPAHVGDNVLLASSASVYNTIRFTIASIAGAGATNRIDYVAVRL